jgi:replicative DNA helicase
LSLLPAIDPRPPANEAAPERVLPSNVDAEQALLGCIIHDNVAYERIGDGLRPEHFYEPFHGQLFAAVEGLIRKGHVADPITLMDAFGADPAFADLGGVVYLADLIDRAPPVANARDYARIIQDMALRRDLLRLSGDMADAVLSNVERPAKDHLEDIEQALFGLAENRRSGGVESFGEALASAVELAAQAFSRDGGLSGLSTGLIDLDSKLGGLHPSDLVVIAARPSMGKTSLGTNIAHSVAKAYRYEPQPDGSRKTVSGGVVLFFSLEMSSDQLALRVAAADSGVSGDRIRKGEINASEFGRFRDASIDLAEIPLYIDSTGGNSMARISTRSRRQKRMTGLDLIVVDYLQLVDSGLRGGANRVEQITMITQGLKALAKELNVPVVALSQLSRAVEQRDDKKPQLSDLRESGSIEQDADMVLFIYREEYYLSRTEPRAGTPEHLTWTEQMDQCRGLAEVIIGKQRHGPIGTVRLTFNEALTKFGNVAREFHFAARKPYGED